MSYRYTTEFTPAVAYQLGFEVLTSGIAFSFKESCAPAGLDDAFTPVVISTIHAISCVEVRESPDIASFIEYDAPLSRSVWFTVAKMDALLSKTIPVVE